MIMRDEMLLRVVRASIMLFVGAMMPFAAGGQAFAKVLTTMATAAWLESAVRALTNIFGTTSVVQRKPNKPKKRRT